MIQIFYYNPTQARLFTRARRRPSQGSASVLCYNYLCFLCSEFPARLQSLDISNEVEKLAEDIKLRRK